MEQQLLFDDVFLGLCDCNYYCSEQPNCSIRWHGRRDEAWCREANRQDAQDTV